MTAAPRPVGDAVQASETAETDDTPQTDRTARPAEDRAAGIPIADEGELADELSFGLEVSARAGRLLMERYERVERIDYKSARDVVTEVDHLSEAMILHAIRGSFPLDGILAEESGEHPAVRAVKRPSRSARTAGLPARVWVVDPLDGTVNYANGIPFFCVSIALLVGGRPSIGIVHDPARLETFSAAASGPARLDGRPIVPSDKERLSDFVISLSLGGRGVARRGLAVRKAIRVPRSMGSAALALAYVANGRFDAFVQQGGLSAWDVAAAGLIAERSGAAVTDMAGGAWFDVARGPRTIGIIAAPVAHHGALLDLVRAPSG